MSPSSHATLRVAVEASTPFALEGHETKRIPQRMHGLESIEKASDDWGLTDTCRTRRSGRNSWPLPLARLARSHSTRLNRIGCGPSCLDDTLS